MSKPDTRRSELLASLMSEAAELEAKDPDALRLVVELAAMLRRKHELQIPQKPA